PVMLSQYPTPAYTHPLSLHDALPILYQNGPNSRKYLRKNPPLLHRLSCGDVIHPCPGRKQVKWRGNGILIPPFRRTKNVVKRHYIGKVSLMIGKEQYTLIREFGQVFHPFYFQPINCRETVISKPPQHENHQPFQ